MSEKSDAEEHLEDVLVVVQLLSNEISMSDNLRPQLDTILSRIPLEIMEKVNQQKHLLAMIRCFLKLFLQIRSQRKFQNLTYSFR